LRERLGIAGTGAIACGLAATAARHGEVLLYARSPESRDRARTSVDKVCGRLSGEVNAAHVKIVEDLEELRDATFIIEAIVEEYEPKNALLGRLSAILGDDAVLGSTTSSLSVNKLADAAGVPDRFVGLHVFNPVPRMKLVELAFPDGVNGTTRERALALCEDLGKTAVEVPDVPGFVVNRLLFPFLFSAVRLQEETGLSSEAIDECMKLGAGHPMGPLALLDFVGLDVSKAIGESVGTEIPARVDELIAEGALGKKSGRGFYDYSA
jgi:3-hydroxybutyryl-CoA dehydrogenase